MVCGTEAVRELLCGSYVAVSPLTYANTTAVLIVQQAIPLNAWQGPPFHPYQLSGVMLPGTVYTRNMMGCHTSAWKKVQRAREMNRQSNIEWRKLGLTSEIRQAKAPLAHTRSRD